MLSPVSGNVTAAGRAVSHKLLTFEDGGTAMKLPHINKKLPPLAWKCQAETQVPDGYRGQLKKTRTVFVCLWSSVVTCTNQVCPVMKGGRSVTSSQAPLWCWKSQSSVVILRDFPGIIYFWDEIGLKHISKGHFDRYYFINTTSGLRSTCHIAEIIKMRKHLLNLSHGPTSCQTHLLFVHTYSWRLKAAWNNVWQDSSHCNWSTTPLSLELLAFVEMAVGLQTSSNASSQDVVNKLFRASFQNPFLCFIPSPRKVGITQFIKSMAFCGIYSKYSS